MAEPKVITKDDVKYFADEVKSGKKIVGLAPTQMMTSLIEMEVFFKDDEIFKLAYRQLRTDHKNAVRAKFNGTGKSAVAVVASLAAGTITVEEIQEEQKHTGADFTTAATKLLQTDPDPTAIHWDVL